MKTDKIYKGTLPLYPTSLQLIVTDDVYTHFKEHCTSKEGDNPLVYTGWVDGVLSIVASRKHPLSVGTFAHEAVHMAIMALDHHHVKWSKDNDEALAYPVGWIVDWMARVLKRNTKHVK